VDWAELVSNLRESLPHESVLVLALTGEPASASFWPADYCPACGKPAVSERSPYCGDVCRDRSAFIRQVRAGLVKGELQDAERRAALDQVLWALLGGGYPRRLLEVPERVVAKVLERDQHRCHACGAEAQQIEHLRTACNRPINLGAVCGSCRTVREFGDATFLRLNETESIRQEIAGRVLADPPARRCDDPDAWDWRAFLRERKV